MMMIQTRKRTNASTLPDATRNGRNGIDIGENGDRNNTNSSGTLTMTQKSSVFQFCTSTIIPLFSIVICIIYIQRSLNFVNNITEEQQKQKPSTYIVDMQQRTTGGDSGMMRITQVPAVSHVATVITESKPSSSSLTMTSDNEQVQQQQYERQAQQQKQVQKEVRPVQQEQKQGRIADRKDKEPKQAQELRQEKKGEQQKHEQKEETQGRKEESKKEPKQTQEQEQKPAQQKLEHREETQKRKEEVSKQAQEQRQEQQKLEHKEETKELKEERNEELPQKDKQPLNVVLFYADDWTYTTLGAMGNEHVYTPHLDALAKNDGILFTHNCVVTSVCMQSRATLYTGQYSSVHQSYFSWRDVRMYEEGRWNQTLYPTMTRNNYHTGFFGKYHHLENFDILPPTFTKFRSTVMMHMVQCPTPRNRQDKDKTLHITQCNEEDGIDFLTSRPKDQPFFLTLSFFATHAQDGNDVNYQPQNSTEHLYTDDEQIPLRKTNTEQHWQKLPPFFNDQNAGRSRYRGRYDTTELYQHNMKRMYRMANEVDATCGKIIQLLKEQNVYDNTLIIFTTDNGNFHGEHGLSEKWYAYEESIRVPLIVKDPRMLSTLRGTKNSELTLNIDLAPTILSAANIPVPSVMQGRDMATMYSGTESTTNDGKQKWRKEFLYEFYDDNPTIPNSIALVGHKFKYIYWNDYNYTQYFDLSSDPYEEYDLYHNDTSEIPMTDDPTFLFIEARNKLNLLQQSVQAGLPQ